MSSPETYVTKPWDKDGKPDFATIDYADSADGYEWDEFHVIRGRDGNLYVGADSGCSCNDFYDAALALDDLTRVSSWIEAAEQVKEWISDSKGDRETAGMNLIERLTNTRPTAVLDIDPETWPTMSTANEGDQP